ncbi:MAG: class II fructose-bisphosphate aldolase [Pseudomonadota bacterium]
MTLATLTDVLQPALRDGYAVAGFVVLGWEDARAYAMAAQDENLPVILQAGPSCRAHTHLPVLGAMFRSLANDVDVPVVAHLDHGNGRDECMEAIDSGFTSVMFDGSRLSFEDNIEQTALISELAHEAGVSCEGEIGFVGYQDGEASSTTDPAQAAEFARRTGVDAMAISVGNVHLQQSSDAAINEQAIRAIEATCKTPLVIHGGSGVPAPTRARLATGSNVCKFNIGTEMRMEFGMALRRSLNEDQTLFDRVAILKQVEPPLRTKARLIMRNLVGDQPVAAG